MVKPYGIVRKLNPGMIGLFHPSSLVAFSSRTSSSINALCQCSVLSPGWVASWRKSASLYKICPALSRSVGKLSLQMVYYWCPSWVAPVGRNENIGHYSCPLHWRVERFSTIKCHKFKFNLSSGVEVSKYLQSPGQALKFFSCWTLIFPCSTMWSPGFTFDTSSIGKISRRSHGMYCPWLVTHHRLSPQIFLPRCLWYKARSPLSWSSHCDCRASTCAKHKLWDLIRICLLSGS